MRFLRLTIADLRTYSSPLVTICLGLFAIVYLVVPRYHMYICSQTPHSPEYVLEKAMSLICQEAQHTCLYQIDKGTFIQFTPAEQPERERYISTLKTGQELHAFLGHWDTDHQRFWVTGWYRNLGDSAKSNKYAGFAQVGYGRNQAADESIQALTGLYKHLRQNYPKMFGGMDEIAFRTTLSRRAWQHLNKERLYHWYVWVGVIIGCWCIIAGTRSEWIYCCRERNVLRTAWSLWQWCSDRDISVKRPSAWQCLLLGPDDFLADYRAHLAEAYRTRPHHAPLNLERPNYAADPTLPPSPPGRNSAELESTLLTQVQQIDTTSWDAARRARLRKWNERYERLNNRSPQRRIHCLEAALMVACEMEPATSDIPFPQVDVLPSEAASAAIGLTIDQLQGDRLVERVGIADYLPDGLCPLHASAIIVWAFLQPGQRGLFFDNNYLPLQHIQPNVRRKLRRDFDARAYKAAYDWLRHEEVIIKPRNKRHQGVRALNARPSIATAAGRPVVERIVALQKEFRRELR